MGTEPKTVTYYCIPGQSEAMVTASDYERLQTLARNLAAALEKIALKDWFNGGAAIHGNAELQGCEEFYRGYNAGVDTQFEKTQRIASAALSEARKAGLIP